MFNFDNIVDRRHSNSVKYEEMELNFGRSDLLPFWVADMEFKSPDFMVECLIKRAEHGVFGYTKRMDSYYKAIQKWLDKRHNWNVIKEWIEYAPGVVPALSILIRNFTNEKDKIIIQTPVYYPFFKIIEGNKRIVSENKLVFKDERYKMDFDDLKKRAAEDDCKMLILCSPHNPVGRVWEKKELEELGKICLENNVLVISDEIHFDLVYKGYKHIPFASISEDFEKNSITCTAPSKTFNIAGLHTAYCIIPDEKKMEIYKNELSLLDLKRSNCFSQVITEEVYNKGEKWLEELLNYLESNRDFVIDFINNNIQEIKTLKIEGTYLMWLDCRGLGLNFEEIENLFVNKAKLALDGGYWFAEEGKGFMRLNIACARSMLEKGLEKLSVTVKKLNKNQN